MFSQDDILLYGAHGPCRYLGLEERRVNGKRQAFYVLEPLARAETRFLIPTENPAAVGKIRRLPSRPEVERMLASERARAYSWEADENKRKNLYRALLSGTDRAGLVSMICSVECYRLFLREQGRKLHQCDENFLRDAQRLIAQELAMALDLPPDQVGPWVREQMGDMSA